MAAWTFKACAVHLLTFHFSQRLAYTHLQKNQEEYKLRTFEAQTLCLGNIEISAVHLLTCGFNQRLTYTHTTRNNIQNQISVAYMLDPVVMPHNVAILSESHSLR